MSLNIEIILDYNHYYTEVFNYMFNAIDISLNMYVLRFRMLLKNIYISEKIIFDKTFKQNNHPFNKYYIFNYN